MARVVDLTQPLAPTTQLWPGSAPIQVDVEAEHERDGMYARTLRLPEHAGTHLDAPAHFAADGARVHELAVERLVVAAVLLDMADACGDDGDYVLTAEDVERLERRDGRLPEGCAALVRTGWDRFVGDERYLWRNGELHFPGLAPSAAELLIDRGVTGIGIDTLGVDPGSSTTYPVHHRTLPAGLWHLEGLVNLGALPARGATVVVGALRLVDGSGSPARVIALVPGA